MRALRRKLLRDCWHHRGPLAAIAAVVACGIALFVALRSMHGFLRHARDDWYRQARFADVFASMPRAPGRVVREVAALPGVTAVEGRVVTDVLVDVPGMGEPATGRLVSLPHAVTRINSVRLTAGRWPDDPRGREIVASQAFATANALAPGDSLGAIVNGQWRTLRIVGVGISPEYVYEIGGGAIFPDSRRFGVLWMPHEPLASLMGLTGAANDLAIAVRPGERVPDLIARIDEILRPYGGLGAYPRAEQVSDQFLSGEIDETQVTSLMLPAIFLGVTAFLIHTVLLRLVGTQRAQVATLKAFGYSNTDVGWHYLQLAMVPVGVGSLAGGLGGVWLAARIGEMYVRFFQFPPTPFSPDGAVLATAVAIGVASGVVGALGGVRRSTALAPAEAMQPEAPARFAPGWIERIGVHESPALAMITRNLGRRPVKSALSVFGLSLAGGLVITALGAFDMIEFMKELQFHVTDRSDATVTFARARPLGALEELRHLPGVMAVEGLRLAPVRLHAGQRRYRTVVQALPATPQLRRLVDLDARVHALPARGWLVSRPLADSLGVQAGAVVEVELLEGERRRTQVRIEGVVDDMLGVSAYGTLDDLTMRSGGVAAVSGAAVRLDPRQEAAFLTAVKRLPLVAAVGMRSATLDAFDRTIAESFAITLTVTLGFACVIAFGIVYNSARVALSERGRELASLRILGFTRREVSGMLLGEQGVLLVLALPVAVLVARGFLRLMMLRSESSLFRLPLVLSSTSILLGGLAVLVAAALTGLLVVRRIHTLDLVGVLKTRE